MEKIEKLRVYLPPVDAGRLKIFAVLIMLIDHVTYVFLERTYTADGNALMLTMENGRLLDSIGRAVGRQAFPIFCFFLVEGFLHTRSRLRYLGRLLFFAALSQVPFQKCFFPRAQILHANVLCTLALGLLTIWALETLEHVLPGAPDSAVFRISFLAAGAGVVLAAAQAARFLHSDYSFGGVLMIVIMYLFRNYRISSLFISWIWLSWYNRLEMYAAPAFLLLACYNEKRGKQNKYFFYTFYPAHLTLLWLLRAYLFGQ